MSAKEPDLSVTAASLKADGTKHFKKSQWSEALIAFTAAIAEEPNSPALYANRSLVAMKLKQYGLALQDAKSAIEVWLTYCHC